MDKTKSKIEIEDKNKSDSRLESLRKRVELLLGFRHDFLEQISSDLPGAFENKIGASAELFKWFEGKQVTDAAREAHLKVWILEEIMGEILEEIRSLSGNDPKHLFEKHKEHPSRKRP